MNDAQKAAIGRANVVIAKAMDSYHLRMKLYRKVADMADVPLRRLVAVVEKLTPDELDAALGYAEGLAAWAWVGEESSDAAIPPEGTLLQDSRTGHG